MLRASLIAIGIAATLALPSMAAARTTVAPADSPQIQAWVAKMKAPIVPNQLVIVGACPGYDALAACNFPTTDSPIYIRADSLSRPLLYREFGGRFGTLAMTQKDRRLFAAILHTKVPWSYGTLDANGLDEVFEDAYANCALGYQPHVVGDWSGDRWVGDAGYEPNRRQHKRVCALIARSGARAAYTTP